MVAPDETKSEVISLLKAKFPKSGTSRVDVADGTDWQGEPSIDIRIVFRRNPSKDEMRYARPRLIDELRTWLSKRGDERFPYFSFLTEKDEKELLRQT
jgi:hypothetical protein